MERRQEKERKIELGKFGKGVGKGVLLFTYLADVRVEFS